MTLIDEDDDINIIYVEPKYEQILDPDIKHINRTEIVTENDLRSAGIDFKMEIDIDEETKQHFAVINHDVPSHESLDDHQLCLQTKFNCNQCSATFTRNDALTRHLKIHAIPGKAYTCDYCSKSYSRRNCIRHMKAVHVHKEETRLYECYVCGVKYKRLFSLKNHVVLHYDGKTFQCKICAEKFAHQSALTKHIRSKHANGTKVRINRIKFQCKDCTFETANKDHFRNHFQTHHTRETLHSLLSCKICPKTFSTKSSYQQHMRVHLKLFKCDSCPKAFSIQSRLNRHSAVHSMTEPTCHICNRQVKRGTLKRHMRIHVTEKSFQCGICPRSFSLEINLNKHLSRHVIGKKYQCYMCPFGSKYLNSLRFHFCKHIGKKIYKCKICFKRFLQKDHWRSHSGLHISGKFSCDFCAKTFSYAEILRRHIVRHNQSFECTVCSRVLTTKASLQHHIRSVHNAEKTHKCDVCSRMFFGICNLRRHIQNVHRGDKPIENEYRCTVCTYVTYCKHKLRSHSKWHKTERPHACIECPKSFKTGSCLSKHMKGCHSKQPKIYTCNICSQTFNDRSSRLKHKRIHITERIYKCSICSFETKTEFRLKLHMNVHTQPFQCNICLRKFSTKGNLDRHQKTHGLLANGLADSKIKYECYICGHSARRGHQTLKIHFSKHTGEKLFECNVCTRSFSRPDYLRLHLRIHTGDHSIRIPLNCQV